MPTNKQNHNKLGGPWAAVRLTLLNPALSLMHWRSQKMLRNFHLISFLNPTPTTLVPLKKPKILGGYYIYQSLVERFIPAAGFLSLSKWKTG